MCTVEANEGPGASVEDPINIPNTLVQHGELRQG